MSMSGGRASETLRLKKTDVDWLNRQLIFGSDGLKHFWWVEELLPYVLLLSLQLLVRLSRCEIPEHSKDTFPFIRTNNATSFNFRRKLPPSVRFEVTSAKSTPHSVPYSKKLSDLQQI
ncbi:MAG: hypothetical protein DME21_01700 [Verrucomicrobia bacterium]|nr:MAG: hypothetical protein DME21_01700 [Verrucomicrobiota bacterium]